MPSVPKPPEDDPEPPPTEDQRVVSWRFDQFVDAGFDLDAARELSLRRDVDLRHAISLLSMGCSVATATDILL